MKYMIFLFIGSIGISSCGSLGGFDSVGFLAGKKQLSIAIDSLYSEYPEYKLPQKWKEFDDWEERGFATLDGQIFYFKDWPEEMYYVSFVGDSTTKTKSSKSEIAIRAIFMGHGKWLLERDLNQSEKSRIQKRFNNEVVTKLEYFAKTRARLP